MHRIGIFLFIYLNACSLGQQNSYLIRIKKILVPDLSKKKNKQKESKGSELLKIAMKTREDNQ